jgi:hypothetical protein
MDKFQRGADGCRIVGIGLRDWRISAGFPDQARPVTGGGLATALTMTLVLKLYREKTAIIKIHPRMIAPKATPSITT